MTDRESKDPFPESRCGNPRRPLQRPLRLTSKTRWMEGRQFTVDDQDTRKVLRDCTEDERQYILESGFDIFARVAPHSAKLAHRAAWAAEDRRQKQLDEVSEEFQRREDHRQKRLAATLEAVHGESTRTPEEVVELQARLARVQRDDDDEGGES